MHMYLKKITSVLMICLGALAFTPAAAEPIDLSKPYCPSTYSFAGGKCEVNKEALDKIKTLPDCTAAGGTLTLADNKCKLPDALPAPACRNVAGGTQSVKGDKCMFDTKTGTSASGDYVGDYFEIVGVPADNPDLFGGPPGTRLRVLSQSELGPNDRMLNVVSVASDAGMFNREKGGAGIAKEIKASDLIAYGARRTGWTYGALAIPYKYYVRDKSFGPGVAIGPYVGRRWGRPGSAYTVAVASTIGNVKGEVRDAQDKITSTPDLMAYSMAAGVMWDISKAQGVKPFKMGLFIGVDSVSSDKVVQFKNNRKGWLALQIGFDFTDN